MKDKESITMTAQNRHGPVRVTLTFDEHTGGYTIRVEQPVALTVFIEQKIDGARAAVIDTSAPTMPDTLSQQIESVVNALARRQDRFIEQYKKEKNKNDRG